MNGAEMIENPAPQDDKGELRTRDDRESGTFLHSLTTPPLRGTPPTEGNWVWCFIFYCVLLMCRGGAWRPWRSMGRGDNAFLTILTTTPRRWQ